VRQRDDVVDTLRQRLISARHFGTLPPGGKLPSARVVAAELRTDPRVVIAAYQLLEREGLVERRPPSRAFFATPSSTVGQANAGADARARRGQRAASGTRPPGPPAHEHLDDLLVGVLTQALERDVRLMAFADEARRAVETLRLRAACIECNTDQMAWLCRELQEDYGVDAAGVELEAAEALLAALRTGVSEPDGNAVTAGPLLPRELWRADLLVTTPEHAAIAESLAAATGKAFIIVTQRADLQREIDHLLVAGPVYFLGTDARFAAKMQQHFATTARPEHVRPLILGVDALEQMPEGAPAYVMRTVRDRLGGVPSGVHVLSTLRAFSAESRLRLIRFIVRANRRAASAAATVGVE
jgi:Bacterial regulatory proteins, gntR family